MNHDVFGLVAWRGHAWRGHAWRGYARNGHPLCCDRGCTAAREYRTTISEPTGDLSEPERNLVRGMQLCRSQLEPLCDASCIIDMEVERN